MEQQICQSCAVPFEVIEPGKNIDGTNNQDYCKYCFENGNFTYPTATMGDVIEACIPHTVPDVFPDAEVARKGMQEFFPNLKRWSK